MDFRQLESFVCTVESKSFSAAAEKLYLTQPTVSTHVHALEKELHTKLIKRTTKSFEITDAGMCLYDYAASILQLHRKIWSELSDSERKDLQIGASSVPGQCFLPRLLAEYVQLNPELRFHLSFSDSLDVVHRVEDGSLDVGLVGATVESACTFLPFASDELVIATPNNAHYRDMAERNAPLTEWLQEPFLMRSEHSATKLETEHFLSKLELTPDDLNVVAALNDAEALNNCIIYGLGISILSRRMVEHLAERNEVLIHPIDEPKIVRHLYIAYVQNRYLSRNAADFIRFLKKKFSDETSAE